MTSRFPEHSSPKAAISVAEMARLVGLSYNHFRYLCKKGVFPMPQYSVNNKRPFFDIEAQQSCLQVRQSNIGHNGEYVLFYGPRRQAVVSETSQGGKKSKASDRAVGLATALKHLGLTVTGQQVDEAVPVVFPQCLPAEDGQAIRSLFLHFKKANGR
jgi:hypothetical protein